MYGRATDSQPQEHSVLRQLDELPDQDRGSAEFTLSGTRGEAQALSEVRTKLPMYVGVTGNLTGIF